MKTEEIEDLATLFKALSDENRMSIVSHLCQCRCKGAKVNVGEISACCDVDMSVVSRHLSKLKAAGVLRAHKEGKEVFYRLNGKEIAKQLRALANYFENFNDCKK